MPRVPKDNKRKTGFKEPNTKKYETLLSGYKITLGFILIIIILVLIVYSSNDNKQLSELLSKALFLTIGTFIGRATKK
ncbi:hypothetical protein [Reichenbachiella sp.]|uniref:hypothetical protein n=1 Tax=Reichenbachiella sp. TaxID=2184521 RepID=UPI0032975460